MTFKGDDMNYNLVLHLDSGEEQFLRMCLRNATNYFNALPDRDFKLVLVANGKGAIQFKSDDAELKKWAGELAARGMKFQVCANAMAEHGIKAEELWPICEVVPAGLVAIVEFQQMNYAYVKP